MVPVATTVVLRRGSDRSPVEVVLARWRRAYPARVLVETQSAFSPPTLGRVVRMELRVTGNRRVRPAGGRGGSRPTA